MAPPPSAPIPRDPVKLATALRTTTGAVAHDVDGWRRAGAPAAPPSTLTLDALYEQRLELALAENVPLARAVLPRLPPALAARIAGELAAKWELWRLTPVSHRRHYTTGPAAPPLVLLGYYRAAERRFGVPWPLLAAVNFVESAFNKLRNDSVTGAQGPMQFMPATWRAYGLGGDIHAPRDAIMAAANYLHANGSPGENARALRRYNPSALYVEAVLHYANRIASDPRAFYEYYCWQVFVRTAAGLRRITGPGLR